MILLSEASLFSSLASDKDSFLDPYITIIHRPTAKKVELQTVPTNIRSSDRTYTEDMTRKHEDDADEEDLIPAGVSENHPRADHPPTRSRVTGV